MPSIQYIVKDLSEIVDLCNEWALQAKKQSNRASSKLEAKLLLRESYVWTSAGRVLSQTIINPKGTKSHG